MAHLRELLQEAVNNYNTWSLKNKGYLNSNDLRGILYNKVVREVQKALPILKRCWYNKRMLRCEDMICIFGSGEKYMQLSYLGFDISNEYIHDQNRMKILQQLEEASKTLTYETYPDESYYQIDRIVNNIKNFEINL